MKPGNSSITRDDLKVSSKVVAQGFVLFSIPNAPGVDSAVLKTVRKAVHKCGHVKSAELTSMKNLLAMPHDRNLRKQGVSLERFEEEIRDLIRDTLVYAVNSSIGRQHSKSNHMSTRKGRTKSFVHDKSKTLPVPAPVS